MSRLDIGRRVMLAVAGHDPSYEFANGRGEGAGVDADREAASHFGVATISVVTAWTEQESGQVLEVGRVEPMVWLREALGLMTELGAELGVIKFGLLPSEKAVRAASHLVREARKRQPRLAVVVDPVLGASGGEPFMDSAAREALASDLMCQGVVLTPNRHEAAELAELPIDTNPAELARRLYVRLAGRAGHQRGLVLKGGHGNEDPVEDLIIDADENLSVHTHPRRIAASLHGSGCRHASAVAANLALGHSLANSASSAGTWVASLVR